METPIPVDLGRIAQDLQIRRVQVESVVQLLDEGNTVPFITRYRKERTGNLNEVAIREIQSRVRRLRELAERKDTILKAIEAQGKLSDELREAIKAADNPKRLEDLYLPYKQKKKTKASEAREKGLEPLALQIWNRDETLTDLVAAASAYINAENGLDSTEKVLEGVGHILAESINELAIVRDSVRRTVWKMGKVVTTKADALPEGQGLEFRDYFEYSEPISHIPPHRVLAINRGDKEGPLKVKLDVPRQDLERAILGQLPLEGHPHAEVFTRSALDALDRLLLPSLEREVRRDLTDMAERHAVDVFARNLRSLLLQPPIAKQILMAIDPGLRSGCKVAVLDPNGTLLDQGIIHPHAPQNRRHEAKTFLKDLVAKHQVGVVAIGNGTACRETEELVAEMIAEGTMFHTDPEAAAKAMEAAPAPEAAPAESSSSAEEAPAAEAPPASEASAEPTPAEESAAPAEASSEDGPSHAEQVEAMPPITGGAPDEEETPVNPPDSNPEAAPAETPIDTVPPPVTDPAPESNTTHETVPVPPSEDPSEIPPLSPETGLPEVEAKAEPTESGTVASAPAAPKPVPTPSADFTRPPKAPKDQPKPPKPKGPPPKPKPHAADPLLAKLSYVIVNEAGASVYSASPVGREEFPDFDATTRGTISIGRRLQDPLSELVKIEPQNIGVGLYQHDVNPKQLKDSLDSVIESCVNFVGVDVNTASIPLLRHVSGLNALTARRLVEHRSEKGPFTNRDQIKDVEGVGPATFTQAAGFLKITGAANPLDRTWIHPESYEVATKVLEKFGFAPEILTQRDQLPSLHEKLNEANLPEMARELNVGEPTLHDIFESLARPERDPRDDLPKPIFKKGVLKLEDLSSGMELKGTVLNVVDFGAFVDIGLKDSGLVHISHLANRYIKSPHDTVSVGDVVTVWVLGVDGDRKRVSLTMVKPGTERPRGERGPRRGEGGQGRPQGQGQGQGQGGERPPGGGRGGQGRPPRPQGEGGQAGSGQGGAPAAPRGDRPPGGGGGGQGRQQAVPDKFARFLPQRAQQGGRGPGRGGPNRGGGPGRGGPGGPGPQRDAAPGSDAPKAKPKPLAPPPPLSKDALTGSAPLRTFGQLKQLFEARTKDGDEPSNENPSPESPPPTPETPDSGQGTEG